jgi:serine/threonine protein kinase
MTEEALFAAVLEKPAAERAAFLDQACAGDAALRNRVEALLRSHEEAGSFLEKPPAGDTSDADAGRWISSPAELGTGPQPERPGMRIGPYKLLQQIGEGGMGAVWVAEQTEPVKRRVALKVIKPGMDSAQILARFEAERQALALMDHTHIAKVLDAGTSDAGRPYFVMELVKGVPITKYCDELNLPIRERLALFVPVCQAIQHAHQKGIIHRDLKPSNVLIAMQDGKPVAKVIDFGVAKALHQKLTERTLMTEFGALVGTLEYMSPEQAELSAMDIDTRADVYALGVLLYELLTGSTPLDRKRLRSAAFSEMLRIIREEEPPRPSTRLTQSKESLASLAAHRRTEPARLTKEVRGELDWIVMKALEKDRTRRYEAASGLANDVERYLHDEPVEACPPSTAYRLHKFARRNKAALGTAALVAAALIIGTVISVWQAVEAQRARREADARLEAEQQARREADANFQLARKAVEETVTKVAEEPQLKEADFHDLRRRLMTSAVPFYEEFVKQRRDDPKLEAERGQAYLRLARLRSDMREVKAARADGEQARAIFARLVEKYSGEPDYRQQLATAHRTLGGLLVNLSEYAAAKAEYRAALALCQTLADEFPQVPGYRHDLANSHLAFRVGLGVAETLTERRAALKLFKALAAEFPGVADYRVGLAETHSLIGAILAAEGEDELRAAVKLREALVDDFPGVPDHRAALADDRSRLGGALMRKGELAQAEAEYRAALKQHQVLATKFSRVPSYRAAMAYERRTLGVILRRQGKLAEAEAEYRTALELSKALVAEFPDVNEYKGIEVQGHDYLGLVLVQKGDLAGAENEFRAAVTGLRSLADKSPEGAAVVLLPKLYYNLELVLWLQGKRAEAEVARRAAEAAARVSRMSGRDRSLRLHYEVASLYALASALSTIEPKQADECATRAVALLQKAADEGDFKDPARVAALKTLRDLDPLRHREDFRQLVKRLEEQGSK